MNMRMFSKGSRQDDLYVFGPSQETTIHSVVNNVSIQVWLDRLGHLSYKQLEPLKPLLHFVSSHKSTP